MRLVWVLLGEWAVVVLRWTLWWCLCVVQEMATLVPPVFLSFARRPLSSLLYCLKLVNGQSDWLGGVVANLEPLAFAPRIRRDVTVF